MKRHATNPGTSDVLLIGGVFVLVAMILPNLQIPTPQINVGTPVVNLPNPFAGWFQGNNPSNATAWSNLFGPPPSADQTLMILIDQWFAGSGGYLFGLIGGYDPTNWNAFVAQANGKAFGWPNNNPPPYQTGYFSARVAQYQARSYTTPGGLGY